MFLQFLFLFSWASFLFLRSLFHQPSFPLLLRPFLSSFVLVFLLLLFLPVSLPLQPLPLLSSFVSVSFLLQLRLLRLPLFPLLLLFLPLQALRLRAFPFFRHLFHILLAWTQALCSVRSCLLLTISGPHQQQSSQTYLPYPDKYP